MVDRMDKRKNLCILGEIYAFGKNASYLYNRRHYSFYRGSLFFESAQQESYGGSVSLDSEPDKGTCIMIRFPAEI